MIIRDIIRAFLQGLLEKNPKESRECRAQEKALRNQLSERQIDKIIKDSFPASDPPSTY